MIYIWKLKLENNYGLYYTSYYRNLWYLLL